MCIQFVALALCIIVITKIIPDDMTQIQNSKNSAASLDIMTEAKRQRITSPKRKTDNDPARD